MNAETARARTACGTFIGYAEKIEVALSALDAAGITGPAALAFSVRAVLPMASGHYDAARASLEYADTRTHREMRDVQLRREVVASLRALADDCEREAFGDLSLADMAAELARSAA